MQEAYRFQRGCEQTAAIIPTPMPRKVRPVCCMLKPCLSIKMMGNAWKAR